VSDRRTRSSKRPPELLIRAAVGLGLMALALAAVVLGGWIFWLVVAAMAMVMIAEWADLAGATARDKRGAMLTLVVPLTVMSPATWGPGWFALGIVGAAAVFVAAVFKPRALGLGIIYVGVPVLALLVIRENPEFGLIYTLWTLALVWMCDIGAYFAGKHIGGPKLAPTISPNKTRADRRHRTGDRIRVVPPLAIRPRGAVDAGDSLPGVARPRRRPVRKLAQTPSRKEG
jgi:phosphatidate cytidylyltransferase